MEIRTWRRAGHTAAPLASPGSVGARYSEGQLRQRIVDSRKVNPQTIMPAYYESEGFARVAPAYRGKTILSAEQIEDVVAYLTTLR